MRLFGSGKLAARNEALRAKGVEVLSAFTPDEEFWRDQLGPFLSELQAAFRVGDIATVDQVEEHIESIRALPPLTRALCSGSVLHSAGKLIMEAGPLGEMFCAQVAAAGMNGVHESLADVISRHDQKQARLLEIALDTLWRFEPAPHRELDRAQTAYMRGHLKQVQGVSDALIEALREGLNLLQEVDPSLARSADQVHQVAQAKQQLANQWATSLAELQT